MSQDWCAALFPGQGSQVPGMASELCAASRIAAGTYAEASEILGYDLVAACDDRFGGADQTLVVQPALVTHSVACWRIAREDYGLDPALLAGHSLGEITALVCADAIDFRRAIDLVRHRAQAMAAASDRGAMMVVFGVAGQDVAGHCAAVSRPGSPVGVALRNARDQTVISGDRDAVAAAGALCEAAGGVTQNLKVSIAGHSELMRPVEAPFSERLRDAGLRDPRLPVISGSTGRPYRSAVEAAASVTAQVCGPVDWIAVVEALAGAGISAAVELGPKAVLTKLLQPLAERVRAVPGGTPEELRRVRGLIWAYSQADGGRAVPGERLSRYTASLLRRITGTPARVQLGPGDFRDRVQAPFALLTRRRDELGGDGDPVPVSAVTQMSSLALEVLTAKGFTPEEVTGWLESSAVDAGISPEMISGREHLVRSGAT